MPPVLQQEGEVLTDLCAVCHVNAIKYTCPRCSIHTCSLNCVKKHKQRAQCSGIRNPAEYRKRADLATPASIDKDFNFITKVERAVQSAESNVHDRRINLAPAKPKAQHHSNKSKVDIEAEERRIQIVRAPKGLSRSKINKTHWHGSSKCILWTVEWIDDQLHRKINNIHEFKTITEAYVATFGKKTLLKRKRLADDVDVEGQHADLSQSHVPRMVTNGAATAVEHTDGADVSETLGQPDLGNSQHDNTTTLSLPTEHNKQPNDSQEPADTKISSNPIDPTATVTIDTGLSPIVTTSLHFYLLRPNTEARYTVLIPIAVDQQLRDILSGKTLLEFPTVYALHRSPTELEMPFLLEDEYNKRVGNDIPINVTAALEDVTASAELEEGEVGDIDLDIEVDLTEATLLETLAKDLSS